jgi:hypothetical protein
MIVNIRNNNIMTGLIKLCQLFFLLFIPCLAFSQEYVSVKGNQFELSNGFIVRRIQIENGAFFSTSLSLEGSERNYILESREFAFMVNGDPVDGFSGWDLITTERIEDDRSGRGLKVVLRGRDKVEY